MIDFDMDLLRLVGELRTAIADVETADSDALTPAGPALDHARRTSAPCEPRLSALVEALGGALAKGADVRPTAAAALEALEGLLVESESSEWARSFDERLAELRDAAGTPGVGPVEAVEADGDASTDEASLHGVANRLIQMEPTIIDSLEALRDHFQGAITGWTGSDEVREQLESAHAALRTVASNKRSRKESRVEAVEQVGQALEVAMLEQEEASFTHAVTVARSEDEALSAEKGVVMMEAEEGGPAAAEAPAAAEPEPDEPTRTPVPSPVAGAEELQLIELGPDADPELAVDFVAEGLEYLDQAEEALLHLEIDPRDGESVNVTFRAFHTIKGVAAFLGLEEVTSLAHHAETLLAQVRGGSLQFTETAADLFLRSADVMRALLKGVGEVSRGGMACVPEAYAPLMAQLTDPHIGEKVAGNEGVTEAPEHGEDEAPASAPEDEAPSRAPAGRSSRDAAVASKKDESVRIRTERLDRLVDLVGELVVAQSMIAQDPEVAGSRGALARKVDQAQKILRDLQSLSTSLRMVPLKPAFHKISRVVRDVSHKSGKPVDLVTAGDDTELDRSMVSVVTDPLVHMVRNAVDHGIESKEERIAAGKPEVGTVRLSARQTGGNVVVEIEDDGAGLDREMLIAKAVERGIVDPDRTLDDQAAYHLIFHPGFSTAKKVTDISGRGVGMDVVKRAVESLRGRVEIQSELGKGTRFSIHLPLTLSITDGMLVQVGGQRYIVPTQKIHLTFQAKEEDLWSVAQKGEMVMLHDQLVPVARLHQLYEIDGCRESLTEGLLVVVGEGSRKTALLVDQLLGQQQFVVKALTGQVAGTPGVAGGAILGDGAVGLILDPDELVELARHGGPLGRKKWNAA